MSTDALHIPVDDLVGHTGRDRAFDGTREVDLRLGESHIDGPMAVEGKVVGTLDGVNARFEASARINYVCNRCLVSWEDDLTARGTQHFRIDPDEDGYAIEDGHVDVGSPAKDELALAIPATPLCQENCLGLCPTCGTDLNREPCGGHDVESDSPFAALKDLFDS